MLCFAVKKLRKIEENGSTRHEKKREETEGRERNERVWRYFYNKSLFFVIATFFAHELTILALIRLVRVFIVSSNISYNFLFIYTTNQERIIQYHKTIFLCLLNVLQEIASYFPLKAYFYLKHFLIAPCFIYQGIRNAFSLVVFHWSHAESEEEEKSCAYWSRHCSGISAVSIRNGTTGSLTAPCTMRKKKGKANVVTFYQTPDHQTRISEACRDFLLLFVNKKLAWIESSSPSHPMFHPSSRNFVTHRWPSPRSSASQNLSEVLIRYTQHLLSLRALP